ncbi:MAG: hypothetical protein ACRYG4_15610 [Janthinobacterium lividum]
MIEANNAAFTRQSGYDIAEIVGLPLESILDADRSPDSLSLTDQLIVAQSDGWYLDQSWMTRRTVNVIGASGCFQ